jgi:hypothetical protein
MKPNTITIVGKAAQDAFVSANGKDFSSVNVEVPGPGGRGRAWLDCVAFGELAAPLASLKAGDNVSLVAAPDSRKTEKGWRMRFVVESLNDEQTQLSIATEDKS